MKYPIRLKKESIFHGLIHFILKSGNDDKLTHLKIPITSKSIKKIKIQN